jgi:hypothetical protein
MRTSTLFLDKLRSFFEAGWRRGINTALRRRATVVLLATRPRIMVYRILAFRWTEGVSCDDARVVFSPKRRLGIKPGATKVVCG